MGRALVPLTLGPAAVTVLTGRASLTTTPVDARVAAVGAAVGGRHRDPDGRDRPVSHLRSGRVARQWRRRSQSLLL